MNINEIRHKNEMCPCRNNRQPRSSSRLPPSLSSLSAEILDEYNQPPPDSSPRPGLPINILTTKLVYEGCLNLFNGNSTVTLGAHIICYTSKLDLLNWRFIQDSYCLFYYFRFIKDYNIEIKPVRIMINKRILRILCCSPEISMLRRC